MRRTVTPEAAAPPPTEPHPDGAVQRPALRRADAMQQSRPRLAQ